MRLISTVHFFLHKVLQTIVCARQNKLNCVRDPDCCLNLDKCWGTSDVTRSEIYGAVLLFVCSKFCFVSSFFDYFPFPNSFCLSDGRNQFRVRRLSLASQASNWSCGAAFGNANVSFIASFGSRGRFDFAYSRKGERKRKNGEEEKEKKRNRLMMML